MTKQFEAGKYAIIGKAAMPFCPLCQMRHTVLIVEHIVPVVDLRFIEKNKETGQLFSLFCICLCTDIIKYVVGFTGKMITRK